MVDIASPASGAGASRMPMRFVAPIFIVVCVGAAVAAWLLWRQPDYATLYENLPLEASSRIVAELEESNSRYRLQDGGATIEVPADEVNRQRVRLSAEGGPMTGTDGFELFNESEMGLTEFTQRIKYLRALQGELARTIMAMDDVREARVHLAMPERSLFRAERAAGTAAVSLRTDSGALPSETMVAGIQQLVAAAVPDLSPDRVVVLSSRGEAVSGALEGLAVVNGSTGAGLVSQALAQRMREAVAAIAPGIGIELLAEAVPPVAGSDAGSGSGGTAAAPTVTVRMRTSAELTPDQLQRANQALDRLAVEAGFAGATMLYVAPPLPQQPLPEGNWGASAGGTASDAPSSTGSWLPPQGMDWLVGRSGLLTGGAALVGLLVLLVALVMWRRQRTSRDDVMLDSYQMHLDDLRQELARSDAGAGSGSNTGLQGARAP